MVFVDDNSHEYRFSQPGLNVWRSSFDHWLALQAVDSGAELQDESPVLSCAENADSVSVSIGGRQERTETARYVIDCEGVTGTVKQKLTGIKPSHITTYQTFNVGTIDLDLQYFYAYLQPELSEYDAWFNVKDYALVLGVAVKDATNVESYYHSFIEYMKANHSLNISKELRKDRWLMPWIKPGCHIDYAKGRVFFAGEIAGWLNPMGEGISCGMESAYHLSMAMLEQFNDPGVIESDYRRRTEELHVYMKRQWSLTGDMAGTFAEMK